MAVFVVYVANVYQGNENKDNWLLNLMQLYHKLQYKYIVYLWKYKTTELNRNTT